ncbi:fimbrial protein [Variovorax boronicumulans]|uniref:fimbrial protein n=1 Tax=Variovorax boronicumulans TaxID=436515 RepID=UPI00339783E4
MKRNAMRWLFPAAALLFCAQDAWAICTLWPGFSPITINMVMGSILVPHDAVVGQKLREKDFKINTTGGPLSAVKCPYGGVARGVMKQGQDLNFPGLEKLYSTNVPGIGIRLLRTISEWEKTYYPHVLTLESDSDFDPMAAFRVEVYKTAAVTGSGALAEGTYTEYLIEDGMSVLTTFLSANAITIITPSCTVDTGSRNIPVQFGKVPKSNFKGRGTVTAERDFNITLKCKAGIGVRNTVYLRMDATPDPSNEQGVLRITQAGTATAGGVGIQVTRRIDGKKEPVRFGDEVEVGPSKDGDYVLPYTARYYQTSDEIKAGRADGKATFTLDYK